MKMVRNGRLRKLHRSEWPHFLNRLAPPSLWQQFLAQMPRSTDARTRWSPKSTLLCWVMLGWSLQTQLTQRFQEARQTLTRAYYRRRRCGETYQGLVQATRRFGPELFTRFWAALRSTIPRRVGSAWTWAGWTVFAVDGSRIQAPRTRANERSLRRSGRSKSHPQWWITRLIHLPTRMMWDWRQGPGNSSEREHLRSMIPSLPPQSLLVADIGFGGFGQLKRLCRSGVSFLVRCGRGTTLLVEGTRQRLERRGDVRYVYLWPKNRRRKAPLRLRLIVLKRGRRRVYLLTNVLEPTRLSRRTAGQFYQARWQIEVEYRGLKQTLGHHHVLARTPRVGSMELAAYVLAMALLLLQGALMMGAKVARLSLAAAVWLIRQTLEALRHDESCRALLRKFCEALQDDYLRHAPKRARDWARKKTDPPPRPPKLRRPNRREKRMIHSFWPTHGRAVT